MKKVFFLAAVAGLMAVVGCNRIEQDGAPEGCRTLRLHITAQTPELTKTTLGDDLQIAWEGNEKLGVIFGNSSSSSAANSAVVEIPSIAPGIFEGEILVPDGYTASDIRGVAYPAEGSFFKYQSGANRIVTTVPFTQTQATEGKLNGKNFPLFAVWDPSKWEKDESTYTTVDLSLEWASAILQFKVYGTAEGLQAGEKFQSMEIRESGAYVVGTAEYNTAGSNAGKFSYNGQNGGTINYSLETPVLLSGRTQADPLILYVGALGRKVGTNSSKDATITSIKIMTDKATYTYTPEGKTISPAPGEAYPLGLNLAKFTRASKISYSADGGTTWANQIPATFTTLAVKSSVALSEIDLQAIAAAVKAQSGNVDLDLSQATIERTDVNGTMVGLFPAVFGNATAEKAVANLHTIVFPSNVTAIAEDAFYNCSALESIDLAKITSISGNAFRATGLVDLVVPATVTSMEGKYQFGYCWKLQTLYFDSPARNNTTTTTHTFSLRHETDGSVTPLENLPAEYTTNLIPLTATFGPHAAIGNNDFDTNHKLVKMIFEGKPVVKGNGWVIRCRYLNEFDFSTVSDPVAAGGNNTAAIGELTPENSRKIYVPAGCGEAYYAANTWKALVDNNHFVIVESTESNIQFSTDGGTTWADAIPTGSFTTLAVKGNIFAATLSDIRTAIDAQADGVALDLSESIYENDTFPAVFGNPTAEDACVKITAIVFPSNVTAIAENAFYNCTGLASVDFSAISGIGASAFRSSGLTLVDLGQNITSVGDNAFVYLNQCASIVFDTKWQPANTGTTATFRYTTTHSVDMTFTVGANAQSRFPRYGLDQNLNLTHLIINKDVGFQGYSIRGTDYLATIEFRCATPGSLNENCLETKDGHTIGSKVTGAKRIIVPKGATSTFTSDSNWTNWAKLLTETYGYTLEEASE